jgi:U4/U6 small nuclear ribonucleoprotein PRP4
VLRIHSHQIATGSNDDNIRIWDIRTLKAIYTIPAHTSAVSDLKFYRAPSVAGFEYPCTIDVDGKSKEEKQSAAQYLNGTDRIKLEEGGEGVEDSSVSLGLSGLYLASSGYDGYVKLWSAEDWQLIKAMSSEAGGRVMSVDVGSGTFTFKYS